MDVSIVSCSAYESDSVYAALKEALEAIDGLSWLKPGMSVAIKANLVSAKDPDAAATTHPLMVAQLSKMLLQKGASKVIVGDSPGGPFTQALLSRTYNATGMHLCEEAGAVLNDDFTSLEAEYPDGISIKRFTYSNWLKKADAIVNFCKLKTHGLMGLTAAQKNLYGVIPGAIKAEYHYIHPKLHDFANLIVDLDEYVKPELSICDAVVGMEGNGPSSGKPRHIGAVIASKSPHMLDMVAAEVIGLEPSSVPTIAAAIERRLIPSSIGQLEVYGNSGEFRVSDFDRILVPNSSIHSGSARGLVNKLKSTVLETLFRPKPALKGKCVGCGRCVEACPADAIHVIDGIARINRKKCVKCFCCQEFCPLGVMGVERTIIAKLINK